MFLKQIWQISQFERGIAFLKYIIQIQVLVSKHLMIIDLIMLLLWHVYLTREQFHYLVLIFQVRWVASQTKAIKTIKTNLFVITSHLGEAASRSDMYAGSAKKYLKDLCSSPVLKNFVPSSRHYHINS